MARYAVVIANTRYADPGLAQLSAPGKDAEDFARVLKSKDISAFDNVQVLLNQPKSVIDETLDELFSDKKREDLLLLYFSGHGVKDEQGVLYLAAANTLRSRLRSTAVDSAFIRELMDDSRSESQILILDCCNSGAFAPGTKGAENDSMGTSTAFQTKGRGRVVLTATDSTQYAWEGDKVIGGTTTATENSLFTYYLVKGLEGDADQDGDGIITVDDLYDYAYDAIIKRTSLQTPRKWSFEQQGEIVLRQLPPEEIKPAVLPPDLETALQSTFPKVREAGINQLKELLGGKNVGLARVARQKLEDVAANDDSRYLAALAGQFLASFSQTTTAVTESNGPVNRGMNFQAAYQTNQGPGAPQVNQAYSTPITPGAVQPPVSGAGAMTGAGTNQYSAAGSSQATASGLNQAAGSTIRQKSGIAWEDWKNGFRMMIAWSISFVAAVILSFLLDSVLTGWLGLAFFLIIEGCFLGYATGRVLFPKAEYPDRRNMFLLPVWFAVGFLLEAVLSASSYDPSSASFANLILFPAILGGFGSLGISVVWSKAHGFFGVKSFLLIALSIGLGFLLGSLVEIVIYAFYYASGGGDVTFTRLIDGIFSGAVVGLVAGTGIANRLRLSKR